MNHKRVSTDVPSVFIRRASRIGLAAVAACATGLASAQPLSSQPEKPAMTHTPARLAASIEPPATHNEVSRQTVSVDGQAAMLTRHERQDQRNAGLEGEHFSTVVADDGTLKGFAHISLDLAGGALPGRERAEEIARAFLQQTAPDLLPGMEISWIEPHDELVRVRRAGRVETVTLTGMKVKARNTADGRWFWVIVGADQRPMVFERDIVWVTFPGHRKTEKWLHDAWFKERRGGAVFAAAGGAL